MELSEQIGLSFILLVATAVSFHYFLVTINSSQKRRASLTGDGPSSFGGKLYLAVVVIFWLAFWFSGAYGLLSWLPNNEVAIYIAAVLSFFSLGLLIYIENSVHIKQHYRKSRLIEQELRRLIKYAYSPCQATIEVFNEKAKSAEYKSEREAYCELAQIASALTARDNTLCSNAVNEAKRVADKKFEVKRKAEKVAREQAARIELQEKLRSTISKAAGHLSVGKTIDCVTNGNESLLETGITLQKWRALNEFSKELGQMGAAANIHELLRKVAGVHSIEGTSFEIILNGNERDGFFSVFSINQDIKNEFADGLVFETSIDGLLAAFFFRAALPEKLAWGHGHYGRDQQFIFDQERMIAILENERVSPDNEGLKSVCYPPGLRFSRNGERALTMRCLAYLRGKGVCDYSASITDGVASPIQVTMLFQWGQGVYY